ncbi:MAG: phospholipase D family protein [Agathobacter sp.]|nr:phospholipase D family protein [Agathobacter sp.]
MQVLTNDHYEKILDLFDGTKREIKIISPFISIAMAKKLCDVVSNDNIDCKFITRFYLEDMFAKANSMDAIEMMMDAGIEIYALKGLHTKLYLFDDDYGILGSANFTAGGFKSNIELSLLISRDDGILGELKAYFDDLLKKIKESDEGRITKDVLVLGRKKYKFTFSSKKGKDKVISTFMYGAALNRRTTFEDSIEALSEIEKCGMDEDLVDSMFKTSEQKEQVFYDHTIWLKFEGEGNDRLEAKDGFPMTMVDVPDGTWYLSNYPFKVHSVKEDDEIYFAALTMDAKGKNQPVIVGRGHLAAFQDENRVKEEWVSQYKWMSRYPWYCIIKDSRILDMPVEDGIPMDEIWDELGSDTYISSFGKNERISDVAKKHYQKAHIRLSGNAKDYIDGRLADLEKKYGVIEYNSDL